MPIGWCVGLSASTILFFILHLTSSTALYKKRFEHTYDVRNHFPYEFNYQSPFNINLLGNIALILASALSVGFFSLTATKVNTNGYVLYSLIAGCIYSILICVIHFIPLKYMKTHLIFTVLLLASAFVSPCAIGLGAIAHYQDTKEVFSLVIFIISMVVGGFYFLLAMNPKLSPNIKMIAAKDEQGNEIYLRPKFIVMAFSEWMAIFGLALSHILLILLLIAIL